MTIVEWAAKLIYAFLMVGLLAMLPYVAAIAWAFDPEPHATFDAELLEFWEAWRDEWSQLQ